MAISLSDDWEVFYGFDPLSAADANMDGDGDGLTNLEERIAGTKPNELGSSLTILSHRSVSRLEGDQFARRRMAAEMESLQMAWSSTPGQLYSIWQSFDLTTWEPVPDSNLIALQDQTSYIVSFMADRRVYFRVAIGPGDEQAPSYALPQNPLRPLSSWNPAGVVAAGDGAGVTAWADSGGGDDFSVFGSPTYRAMVTPTELSGVEFSGGAANDAFTSNAGAGLYALQGATEFTAAIVFRPDADGESAAGTTWDVKSRLISAEGNGSANDWGLSYAGDTVWFGLGDAAAGSDASISVSSSEPMAGLWWTAIVTWIADGGAGVPSASLWLFNENGNLVGSVENIDPNTLAGTSGQFVQPRSDTGVTLGGVNGAPGSRNFDGLVSEVQLYDVSVDSFAVDFIAGALALEYTDTGEITEAVQE